MNVTVPIRVISEANARGHWAVKARRAAGQRGAARLTVRAYVREPRFPLVVTITRMGRGKLDSDNLATSCKAVRDGIADALGVDDGDESKVTWLYRQERAKDWAVRIEIARADRSVHNDSIKSRVAAS